MRLPAATLAALIYVHAAELTLPNPSATAGSTVLVPVSFAAQGSAVTALQFDIQYDPAAMSLNATVGDAARSSGKSLSLYNLAPGQSRFVVSGLNQKPIPDGPVAGLFFSLTPTAAGAYAVRIAKVVGSDSSAQPVNVKATDGSVTVQGAGATVQPLLAAGVLNGASLLPGPVAPGEIVTLFGAGIAPDAAVRFDGTPAPLLYAAGNQVNAIVPYAIRSKASTRIEIVRSGRTVAEVQAPVAEASPAVFTMDGTGVGQSAILNQDGAVNSAANPAVKGEAIMIFATGAGQTDPPGVDGLPAAEPLPKPLLPVSVEVGGAAAPVLYAGAAPGLVSGVLQVNCIVPLAAISGVAVPLTLYVGGIASPAGATVSIR